jgi:signal transduction histidine kinase
MGPFHRTIAWFQDFFLMVYAAEPLSDDDFVILQRFGRVFDVAYRRFRELQLKEAQNHELALQNSLERIRTHALSMQSTDDFPSVAAAVFREAEHLNFEVVFSAIGIVHEQQDRIDQWGVARDFSPEHLEMVRQRFPVFDEDPMVVREHFVISKVHQVHPYVEQSFRVSPTPGQLTHVPTFLTAEELTSWLDNMGLLGIWDEEYAASAPREFPPDGMHISTILFDHGYIWFYLNAALNEQQIAEAERFTDVFSFAYDRYLQLQASEERAHEAQLEAAAERVRAAAMEMRSADEIRNVVGVVRRELIALGFSARFPININYLDEKDDEHCYVYCSAPNPRQIELSWTSPELIETDEHTVTYLEVMKISYRPDAFASSEVWRIDQRDDEFSLQRLDEMLASLGIDPGYDEIFDFGTHVTGIPFAHGQIVVRGNDGLADEQVDIVRTLCDGLSLGFTRFQDFQQLEAEAERARLEAAAERVRAAAMEMRSADEIRNVVGVVRRQLIALGFSERFATMINYVGDDDETLFSYFAMKNPRRHGFSWTSPDLWELDEDTVSGVFSGKGPATASVRESVTRGEIKRFESHQSSLPQADNGFGIDSAFFDHVEMGTHLTCIPFTHGQIALRYDEFLNDEQVGIVGTLCDGLSLGFTRFKDFQQLETASANKSQFLRRMSHDLRSPMNAIIGYSRLLQRRLADRMDEREARNLANIETSSGNLLNLINDILDLSRIEAGRIEINEQPVDVRKLADECADALESIVHANVVLHRALEDVGIINSDPDRLRQVVMNLLGNATKFTESGSITLSLRSVAGERTSTDSSSAGHVDSEGAASSDNHHIQISVADTGIGIPPEDLPHIFDEFRQVERQGGEGAEGTGLGLAIAKKTVDLLGGDITATSEVGVGTTFTVTLRAS